MQTENHISNEGNIKIGVPQGSIVGLMIFLLYVNGITLLSTSRSKILVLTIHFPLESKKKFGSTNTNCK